MWRLPECFHVYEAAAKKYFEVGWKSPISQKGIERCEQKSKDQDEGTEPRGRDIPAHKPNFLGLQCYLCLDKLKKH
jgi:hypothetical protein